MSVFPFWSDHCTFYNMSMLALRSDHFTSYQGYLHCLKWPLHILTCLYLLFEVVTTAHSAMSMFALRSDHCTFFHGYVHCLKGPLHILACPYFLFEVIITHYNMVISVFEVATAHSDTCMFALWRKPLYILTCLCLRLRVITTHSQSLACLCLLFEVTTAHSNVSMFALWCDHCTF